MGCSGSRLGHGHAGVVLPPRLRPLFLLRLEEFRMRHRRHVRPIKDSSSTTSKIILLHDQRDDIEEDENSMDSVGRKLCEEEGEGHGKPKLDEVCEKINVKDVKVKEESEFEDALTDAYNSNNDDDGEDDGRMIGRGDGEAFPASPSFRVYFKDVGEEKHDDLGEVKNTNAFKSTISVDDDDDDDNEILSYKETCDEKKKVKKGRRRKSFKKVLPKGGQMAVKNLFTINLCYSTPSSSPSPSPSSSPHHHHHRRRRHNRKDMNIGLIQG